MKHPCAFALLVLLTLISALAACGPGTQPAEPTALPTVQPTITASPQPSLTPTPTEIPLPEGAEELVSRLGEGAKAVLNEGGKYDLIYNETVIGELDNEKRVSFQVEEEIVTISTESLEVKDGNLVSINRQRTEDMGVDWVEQIWTTRGERVAVPEPQVLLPETYEETLIVKEQALDYFMPKLLAAEKKYLDENEWGENDMDWKLPSLKNNTGFPYAYREIRVYSKEKGWPSSYDVLITSWNRIEMGVGKKVDLVGVPFMPSEEVEWGSFVMNKKFVWHFAFDDEATMKQTHAILESVGKNEEYIQKITRRREAKYVFDGFKRGESLLMVRVFVNTENIEGEKGFVMKQYQIERFGLENIEKLMKRLEGRVPEYSDLLGREMVYWGLGSGKPDPNPPEWFAGTMEGEIIPSAVLIWDY